MQLLLRREVRARNRQILAVFLRHLRGDLAEALARDGDLGEEVDSDARSEGEERAGPEAFAADLESLGPVAVKVGQTLSVQTDILPSRYGEALERLQDDMEPFSYEHVRETITRDLGKPPEELFRRFEREPLAAASMGQVHRAITWGGRQVSVKVLRPGIRKQIRDDLEAFELLVELLDKALGDAALKDTLSSCRRSILAETDLTQEARNLRELRRAIAGFDRIRVPEVIEGYCGPRVLTMEFLVGEKVPDLSPERIAAVEPELGEQLFCSYLHQILVAGVFHADPHPGNLLLLGSGELGLIDAGSVARLSPRLRQRFMQLVVALAEGRGERVAQLLLELGQAPPDLDLHTFRRAVSHLVVANHGSEVADLRFGKITLEVAKVCQREGVRLPPQLTLAGRAFAYLEDVFTRLAPDLEPSKLVEDKALELLGQQQLQELTPLNLLDRTLRTRDVVERIPGRLSRLLDQLTENELLVRVDAIDEKELIRGLQKIANRVAAGVVVASMIVGAALIIRVESAYTVFGYPALAVALLLAAALAGGVLLVQSLIRDR